MIQIFGLVFLLTKKFDFLDNLLENRNVQLVFCDKLLSELIEVVSRPKLKRFFTHKDWDIVSSIIEELGIFYSVVSHVEVCRDPKDNFLLSLAKDSNADYLLTGDKDLLMLQSFEATQIVTVVEFKSKLQNF